MTTGKEMKRRERKREELASLYPDLILMDRGNCAGHVQPVRVQRVRVTLYSPETGKEYAAEGILTNP